MTNVVFVSNIVSSDSVNNIIGRDNDGNPNKAIPATRPTRFKKPTVDMSKVWIVTNTDSRKYYDMIKSNNNYSSFLFMDKNDKKITYCTLYGKIRVETDKNEIESQWKKEYIPIFDAAEIKGEPAPNYVVLRLDVEKIEMISYRFGYTNMEVKGWRPHILIRKDTNGNAKWVIS